MTTITNAKKTQEKQTRLQRLQIKRWNRKIIVLNECARVSQLHTERRRKLANFSPAKVVLSQKFVSFFIYIHLLRLLCVKSKEFLLNLYCIQSDSEVRTGESNDNRDVSQEFNQNNKYISCPDENLAPTVESIATLLNSSCGQIWRATIGGGERMGIKN